MFKFLKRIFSAVRDTVVAVLQGVLKLISPQEEVMDQLKKMDEHETQKFDLKLKKSITEIVQNHNKNLAEIIKDPNNKLTAVQKEAIQALTKDTIKNCAELAKSSTKTLSFMIGSHLISFEPDKVRKNGKSCEVINIRVDNAIGEPAGKLYEVNPKTFFHENTSIAFDFDKELLSQIAESIDDISITIGTEDVSNCRDAAKGKMETQDQQITEDLGKEQDKEKDEDKEPKPDILELFVDNMYMAASQDISENSMMVIKMLPIDRSNTNSSYMVIKSDGEDMASIEYYERDKDGHCEVRTLNSKTIDFTESYANRDQVRDILANYDYDDLNVFEREDAVKIYNEELTEIIDKNLESPSEVLTSKYQEVIAECDYDDYINEVEKEEPKQEESLEDKIKANRDIDIEQHNDKDYLSHDDKTKLDI